MKLTDEKLGYVEGWASIVVNTLLFGLKFWAGTAIGSVSMVADAWHTLSDTLTSVVVIIGFWISAKPADKAHPFGHARAEQIAAVIIGVLLAVVGGNFIMESVKRLVNYRAVSFSLFGIIVFGVSILLKEGLSQFAFWAGRKIDSKAVKADGWHHRSDAIASGLIVVGAIFGTSVWWIDGALGICVSLLILYAAFDILKSAATSLLGEAPNAKLEHEVRSIIQREHPSVDDIHHLHIHRYGKKCEMTVHIRLDPDMHISEAHKITSGIESILKKELSLDATVHVEPVKGA